MMIDTTSYVVGRVEENVNHMKLDHIPTIEEYAEVVDELSSHSTEFTEMIYEIGKLHIAKILDEYNG